MTLYQIFAAGGHADYLKPFGIRLLRSLRCPSVLVFAIYLALACLATFPAILRLSTELIGEPGSDAAEMVWLVWWLKRALLDSHWRVTEIPLLFYPEGLSYPLLATQLGVQVLSLPIAFLSSPVVAYNLSMLFSLALAGLTAYWLGLALSKNRLAAFVGGMVWAFFPNKMGHALGGHIYQVAVFLYPLYVLFLWRMLQQPSARRGLLAGLVGVLTATIHSVHVVYFLVPVTLILVGADWLGQRQVYWTRPRRAAYSAAVLIGLATSLPLYWPVLQQARQGTLEFLAVRGAVGFAADLAAYFVPAPENPLLVLAPDVREFSRRVNATYNESITYLGLIPMALAGLGLWRAWGTTRRWLTLGILTGLLSLGPLLKFGGRLVELQIEDFRSGIVLPYALLMNLPFLQWSRTPARLNETTSFALAVLVVYGAAWLLAQVRSRAMGISLAALLSGLIFLEYLVVWPFPMVSVAGAELYRVVRDQPGVVLSVPTTNIDVTMQALLGQTVHGQPMIGGRLLREVPGKTTLQDFLNRLILLPSGDDILPQPTAAQRLEMLDFYNIGWVAYHAVGDDLEGAGHVAVEALLGSSAAESQDQALYSVPQVGNGLTELIYALGDNWYPVETWGTSPTRWFHGNGVVYVYSPFDHPARVHLTIIPELALHVIAVKVNGAVVTEIAAGDWLPFTTEPFSLRLGVNVIELVDLSGERTYVGDLRCAGGTPLSGPFTAELLCEPSQSTARPVTAGVQDFHVNLATPWPEPLASFNDKVYLLQSAWPEIISPGKMLRVTLYWQARRRMEANFTGFVHVTAPDGTLLAGMDQEPMGGRARTTTWTPGQIVAETVFVPIPLDAAPGIYQIRVGWYKWPTLDRLPATSSTLAVSSQIVTLGKVKLR